MYYLNKIVGWVLSSYGILFIGLGVAWWLWGRSRKLAKVLIGVVIGITWFLGCGVTTRLIGTPLEGEEIDEVALPNADAIVLLGGGMGEHKVCGRAEMFSGADRVWCAARLFNAGKAPIVTLSGEGVGVSTVPLLRDLGVDTNKLMFFPAARNTEEEAELIYAELKRHAERPRILLVTSAWHIPRAKMLFERKGFEVIAAPTDYEMHYVAEFPLEVGDFFPNADSLQHNSAALKEWVARFGYWALR